MVALVMYVIIMVYQNEDIAAKVAVHKIESPTWQVPQCRNMVLYGVRRNTTTLFPS